MAIPEFENYIGESGESSWSSSTMHNGEDLARAGAEFNVWSPEELEAVNAHAPIDSNHQQLNEIRNPFLEALLPYTYQLLPLKIIFIICTLPLQIGYLIAITALRMDAGVLQEKRFIDNNVAQTKKNIINVHLECNNAKGYITAVQVIANHREVHHLKSDFNKYSRRLKSAFTDIKEQLTTIGNTISTLKRRVYGRPYKCGMVLLAGLTIVLITCLSAFMPSLLAVITALLWITGIGLGIINDYKSKTAAIGNFSQHKKNKAVLNILMNRFREDEETFKADIAQCG